MNHISEKLLTLVHESISKFENISEEDWQLRKNPRKWNKKEILGHLIDSAANNHQRFVRTQFEESPIIVYNQNSWVESQFYNNADLQNMIKLWEYFNIHLAYLISSIPKEKLDLKCDIRKNEHVTLEWIITDYLEHMEHHINQIIN